jgi:hypothetical protein
VHDTVFEADIFAILACAKECMEEPIQVTISVYAQKAMQLCVDPSSTEGNIESCRGMSTDVMCPVSLEQGYVPLGCWSLWDSGK